MGLMGWWVIGIMAVQLNRQSTNEQYLSYLNVVVELFMHFKWESGESRCLEVDGPQGLRGLGAEGRVEEKKTNELPPTPSTIDSVA